jgi:protein tyrosine phosphatase (PTP) superfamily phosphohydrolase (DUF442 family)
MTSTLSQPVLDAPSRSARRRWRRHVLRLALGFAAVLAIGNIFILAASALAKTTALPSDVVVPDDVASIHNFEAIDSTLWRGGAPGQDDYRALAAAGVTTVVDLRAEDDLRIPDALLAELGLTRVAIPIRDGQTPTYEQVQAFLGAVDASDGTVYLHCGAGVGRTGTMAAVYSVSRGGGGWSAMRANLAVGPPSIEQLAFAASLDAGEAPERPNLALVAISRTFDAPRRILKVLGL